MRNTIKQAALLAITACGITLSAVQAQDSPANKPAVPAAPTLKVGDPAPEFKVTQWFKGEPVTMAADKTYIVECWATWCGPCVMAFPHLSEVAKANKDKIAVIGVNVWERKKPEEVKAFVEAQGEKMSYLVAADGDGVIANHWLKAAGQTGIPCAFVVHKGKVLWIGHPSGLEQKLLDSILDGTFDVAAFAKSKAKEEAAANYFKQNIMPLMQKKDYAGAITKLEEMKKEFPDDVKIIDGHIERIKTRLSK